MRSRVVRAAALMSMLALAGCGSGATRSATTLGAFPALSSSSTSTSSTTTSSSSTSTSTTTTSSSQSAAGLDHTTGYGTYELCQGTCTGSVPAALRRPLKIPTGDGGPCPVTLHAQGPVSPSTSTQVGFRTFAGRSWLGAPVDWVADGSYTGPVLIRGGQIGGSAAIGFGEGATPYDELQLLDAGRQAPRVPGGGRQWLTETRISVPGCYAYQVDGTDFSEVLAFRAVG